MQHGVVCGEVEGKTIDVLVTGVLEVLLAQRKSNTVDLPLVSRHFAAGGPFRSSENQNSYFSHFQLVFNFKFCSFGFALNKYMK